jgi:hypothetical protein
MKAFGRIGCSTLILTVFLASAAHAEQKSAAKAAKGPEGTWKGTINAGGQELRLVVRVSKKSDGSLTGKLDSPDQNANDLPIEDVTWKDGKFSFELKVVKASYEGKVNESGSEVAGDWKQSGQTIPVTFKREK